MANPPSTPPSNREPVHVLANLIELIRSQTEMELTCDSGPIGSTLFSELTCAPELVAHNSPVCRAAKSTPQGELACTRCKLVAQQLARKRKEPWIAACSAGVFEMVWPVWNEDHLVGTLHFGSVFTPDARKASVQRALNRAQRTGVAPSVMRRATDSMPVVTRDKLQAAARYLPSVTRLIQLVLAAHHWMPSQFTSEQGQEVRIRRNSPLVDRACKYVQANYHQSLSSHVVAGALGYNTRYFVRKFAHDAGVPFLRFLALHRMAVARHLLRNTNLSIGDVSEKVGFLDSNYFTATFTRLNKISPTEFRASVQHGA